MKARAWWGFCLAMAGCGGAHTPPAGGGPVVAVPQPAARPSCSPALDDAVEKLTRSFGEYPEEGLSAKVRVCQPGRFGGQPGFFVVTSYGPSDDSKSEEGWSIYRLLVDPAGKLLARGPADGAGWMTGVIPGKQRLVDFDGDGTDEIVEERSVYTGSPVNPTDMLLVYRRNGTALDLVLELALKNAPEPSEGNESPKPDCTATYQIVGSPGHHAIRVQAGTTRGLPDVDGEPAELPDSVRRDVTHAEGGQTPAGTQILCLATGSYRYDLVGNGFVVRPGR